MATGSLSTSPGSSGLERYRETGRGTRRLPAGCRRCRPGLWRRNFSTRNSLTSHCGMARGDVKDGGDSLAPPSRDVRVDGDVMDSHWRMRSHARSRTSCCRSASRTMAWALSATPRSYTSRRGDRARTRRRGCLPAPRAHLPSAMCDGVDSSRTPRDSRTRVQAPRHDDARS